MTLQGSLRAIAVAIALSCGAITPNLAAADGGDTLKTDIDAFFHRMQLAAADRLGSSFGLLFQGSMYDRARAVFEETPFVGHDWFALGVTLGLSLEE